MQALFERDWIGVVTALWYVIGFVLLYLLLPILFRKLSSHNRWKREFKRFMALLSIAVVYQAIDAVYPIHNFTDRLGRFYIIRVEEIEISLLSTIKALYVLITMWYFIRLVRELIYSWICRWGSEVEAGSWRSLISNFGILLVAMVFLLQLGITWKVLLPFAGALGIGLGFGLQTIFNNYISGFILIISRNLKVGDVIEIEGNAGKAVGNETNIIYGKVVDVNVLTTRIHTVDGLEIAIPNSHFVSGKIINYTLSDELVRLHVPFGVAYSSDPEKVRKVLVDVAKRHPAVEKQPPPEVIFYEMADSALVFHLLVWVNVRRIWRTVALRSDLYFKAWDELKKAGVEIPFPQRDIWFRNNLIIEHKKGEGVKTKSIKSKDQ